MNRSPCFVAEVAVIVCMVVVVGICCCLDLSVAAFQIDFVVDHGICACDNAIVAVGNLNAIPAAVDVAVFAVDG